MMKPTRRFHSGWQGVALIAGAFVALYLFTLLDPPQPFRFILGMGVGLMGLQGYAMFCRFGQGRSH